MIGTPIRRILALALWIALLVSSAAAETRVALVIGNSDYAAIEPLKNPANDATDIAEALQALDFDVTLGLDLERREMVETIGAFVARAQEADVTLFYYAGHAFQIEDANYLIPADADFRQREDILRHTVKLNQITEGLQAAGGIHLVFLDACRDNPVAALLGDGARDVRDGLARIGDDAGFLFSFSTQPDNVAYDGVGRNSYFTGAILSHIHTSGQDIASMMISVRNDVLAATGGRQIPWENSSLTRQFHFNPGPPDASPETMLYQVAARAEDPALMRYYLDRYPDGAHVTDVRRFLGGGSGTADTVTRNLGPAPDSDTVEEELWSLARRLRSHSLAQAYLEQHPNGRHVDEARRLATLLPSEDDATTLPGPRCERMTTHPNDATASRAGVPLVQLQAQANAAIRACRAAVDAHSGVAHFNALLARALHAAGRTDEAVATYREAADQGDLRAMVSLGLLMESGEGVSRDLAGAQDLYRRAAEAGSPDGAINLAVMLAEGVGTERDLAAAERWLEQAAVAGSPLATFNLGALLARYGGPDDYSRALEYFREAAKLGESRAYFPAAVLLDKGVGVPADPSAAAEMLLQGAAADRGQTISGLTSADLTWAEETVAVLQRKLAEAGMYRGEVDGLRGPQLAEALQAWRRGGLL